MLQIVRDQQTPCLIQSPVRWYTYARESPGTGAGLWPDVVSKEVDALRQGDEAEWGHANGMKYQMTGFEGLATVATCDFKIVDDLGILKLALVGCNAGSCTLVGRFT